MQFNNPPRRIKNNMTTPHLKKSLDRSPLRLGLFLAALAVAYFALMPFAQSAQAAEENNALLEDNTAEEDDAVLDLTAVAGNAAINGKEKKPNQWVIKIDFEKFIMCAMEKVRFRGELHVKFEPQDFGNVGPKGAPTLKGMVPGKPFSAKGTSPKPLGRTYVLENNKGKPGGGIKVRNENGLGNGSFKRKFKFTAKPNPPSQGDPTLGEKVQFTVEFTLLYDFKEGKNVYRLESRPPEIECPH
jgi:hypothetical protein